MKLTERQKHIVSGCICGYCGKHTKLISSKEVYKKDYGPIWACLPCKAWVGCHPGTNKPLGRVANAELREWKKKAHDAFDSRTWKLKRMTRREAYRRLSVLLGIPEHYTHIGKFGVATCKKVFLLSISGKLNGKPHHFTD